ncbi:hypothetical protein CBC_A0317 [Clostridium botulinum C str. Eklund]|nr:hypothetical protein CBC_A0317 [Clostridium botulinum C str. Eklund]NEZ48866.1 hypothetical protein [Clostridium botulinum]
MCEEDGVYIIKTTYYDNKILNVWKENRVYKDIPESPFWYFAYSPNYIKYMNLNVNSKILNEAKLGTRTYLIPKSYSDHEKAKLKRWLTESSTKGIQEGDIDTVFNKKRNVKFVEYTPKDSLFTWNTKSIYENTCSNPVIYICTPENMIYFESESIKTNAFDGYIKFRNYIDGMQKNLITTIAWFGVVFLILMVILLGILIALATVFRIANQEKINVKKFLGYGFINLYGIPIIMIVSVIGIELIIMFIVGSKFGFLLMIILPVIQMIVFSKYMTKCEIENIRMAFKGE